MKQETQAVVHWIETGVAQPARIEAEITAHCNLNCCFCWIQDPPPFRRQNLKNEMSFDQWAGVAEETAALGVKIWRIGGGGEPMVRPDVTVPLICLLKKHSIFGHLTTNGTIFRSSDITSIVESGWDVIEVSIDGPDAVLHDQLRGKTGAFAALSENITALNREKQRLHSDKPHIISSSVLIKQNLNRLPEMMELAQRLGIEKVSVNPMTVMVRDQVKLQSVWRMKVDRDSSDERDFLLSKAKEEADARGIDTNVHHFISNNLVAMTNRMDALMDARESDPVLAIPCYSPWYLASIRPHGTIGPCCRFKDENAPNLKEQSFKDVWFGSFFSEIRQELSQNRIPAYCAGCSPNNISFEQEIREELRTWMESRR